MSDTITHGRNHKNGPLPLVLGITGHANLRDEDRAGLDEKVRGIFTELQARYPHTPLILLSPLAEGADRLAARVALECGVRLIVPLPMHREIYEADFKTPASRAEFAALLERAEQHMELPLVGVKPEENICVTGEPRDTQYAHVGGYIARQCQILIALWDGIEWKNGCKVGGTAEVVRFKLQGVPEPYAPPHNPLDPEETGPVFHIVTPRRGDPLPEGTPLERRDIFPGDNRRDAYYRTFERMELFNQDAVNLESTLEPARKQSKEWLLQDKIDSLPPCMQSTLDDYAAADSLAIYFQQLTTRTLKRIFIWMFLGALFFDVFAHFPLAPHHAAEPETHAEVVAPVETGHEPPAAEEHGSAPAEHSSAPAEHGSVPNEHGGAAGHEKPISHQFLEVPWFLILFLLISAFCRFVLHRRAQRDDYQNKHQDYRALAEGLRVQLFWRLAGLKDSVADYYLGKQRSELEWIRNAIRVWNIEEEAAPDASEPFQDGMQIAQKCWVEDQKKYYVRKAHQEHEALERDEQRINLFLALSVGLAVLLALVLLLPVLIPVPGLHMVKETIENAYIHGGIVVAMGLLAVGAGLLHSYSQQQALSEHAKQYARMALLFNMAEERLKALLSAGEQAAALDLIMELGKEALAENGDWVLLHRERPLEVPHAG